MGNTYELAADRKRKHDTLVRLANSCERAAARGLTVVPMSADLNEEDYKIIAALLRGLAGTMADQEEPQPPS